jgi:hypothetical protein
MSQRKLSSTKGFGSNIASTMQAKDTLYGSSGIYENENSRWSRLWLSAV